MLTVGTKIKLIAFALLAVPSSRSPRYAYANLGRSSD